jgi:hypothetical protein
MKFSRLPKTKYEKCQPSQKPPLFGTKLRRAFAAFELEVERNSPERFACDFGSFILL